MKKEMGSEMSNHDRKLGRQKELWKPWQDWIERLRPEVQTLLIDDYLFIRSMELIKDREVVPPGNHVYQWIIRTYMRSISAGIRRLIEPGDETVNVGPFARQPVM